MANKFDDFRVGDVIVAASASDPSNDGTYTITSIDDGFLGVTPAPPNTTSLPADTTFTVHRDYSGSYNVTGVADGFIETSATSTFPVDMLVTATLQKYSVDPVSEWTDWVVLPAPGRTEVWINTVAAQGMYADSGGLSPVAVYMEFQIERLTADGLAPTGQVEVVTAGMSGSSATERAETTEHLTAWAGPARVRARRTTPFNYGFAGTLVDEVKFQDLYSVTPITKTEFGNLTTIHTITQATSRATVVKNRELNCLASRRIPTFNGSTFSGAFDGTGRLVSGTISASSKIVDVLAAVALDRRIGNRALSELDMAQMWGVQQQLDAWHPEMGQVNYTLDNDGMSFEETAALIADAGFCIAYRQSGKIRLSMDGAKAYSTALFTHRNKKPNSDTVGRTFVSDSDYDGVEFVYQDPDTETAETIRLPLDGSAVRPKKFEIPGIRSFAQAWRRAWREYLKIRGQRLSIETTCTTDARSLLPNARIDIVDNTRFKSYDGEVIGQAGLVLRLSQRVVFAPGEPHSIVLMRRDGSLQAIACTPGVDDQHVVLQGLAGEAIVTEGGADGVATIYSFGPDSRRGAQAWLVTDIAAPKDGYVTVKAANYSDGYYAQDFTDIPPSGSIIN